MHEFSLGLQRLSEAPSMRRLRAQLDLSRILEDAIAIQQIPAPTFDESRRAQYVRQQFAASGLNNVQVDSLFNVFGRMAGSEPAAPALLVSAHTDTVFPLPTDLTVRREGSRIFGPGLGDNSMGVAGLLTIPAAFRAVDLQPPTDVWFVANSREEGMGDLGGMRAVLAELGPRLGAAVVLEGMALGRIYHSGIAVRRLRIRCLAPGGHSWLHYGRPSAIHELVKLATQILAIAPPREPRTTLNIGVIEGGHSVNSLATSAEMLLDLRSESPEQLAALEDTVTRTVDSARTSDVTFHVELVGDRPAGRIPRDHPLVALAAAAVSTIHREPVFEIGSTDANILLARGVPAVTMGITYGGNAHRLDEFIETEPVCDGVWHLALLVLAAANWLATQPPHG